MVLLGLLVYTLRFLRHEQPDLSTNEAVKSAMGAAFNQLSSIDAVARDVFISERSSCGVSRGLVGVTGLGEVGHPCRRETTVQVGAGEIQIEKLLRSLNVYIARGEKGEFRVRIMRFIGSNFRVPLFFGASAAAKARVVLERLAEHRVILLQVCLRPGSQTWKDLAHPLLGEIRLCNEIARVDQATQITSLPKVTSHSRRLDPKLSESEVLAQQTIHPKDLARVIAQVAQSCRIYHPRDQSSSADTFIKQPGFILEIQDKSGVGGGLDLAITRLAKVFEVAMLCCCFIAIKLSPTKVKAGVLTSKPFLRVLMGPNGSLLYRESCDSAAWTHTVVDGQLKKVKLGSTPKARGSELHVRPGVEVVVPSVQAVSQFLREKTLRGFGRRGGEAPWSHR